MHLHGQNLETFRAQCGRLLLILLAQFCILSSCRIDSALNSADTEGAFIGIEDERQAISNNIESVLSSSVGLTVCIALIGFDPKSSNLAKKKPNAGLQTKKTQMAISTPLAEEWVKTAIFSWFERSFKKLSEISTLGSTHIDARQAVDKIKFQYKMDTLCPKTFIAQSSELQKGGEATFSVNIFATIEDQLHWLCERRRDKFANCDSKENFSVGEPRSATVIISPLQGKVPREPQDYQPTMTHEFGHLFGLYDVYKRPPFVDFDGPEPNAMMSYKSKKVTKDDLLSLEFAFRFAKTGKKSCDPYKPIKKKGKLNDIDIIFCEFRQSFSRQ